MSFWKHIEQAIADFFGGKHPEWFTTASTTLAVATPSVKEIVSLVAGDEGAAEATSVINEIGSGLTTASKLLADFHTGAPAGSELYDTLASTLNAVNNNVDALLTAGHIKNANTLSRVKTTVGLITTAVDTVLAAVKANAPAS